MGWVMGLIIHETTHLFVQKRKRPDKRVGWQSVFGEVFCQYLEYKAYDFFQFKSFAPVIAKPLPWKKLFKEGKPFEITLSCLVFLESRHGGEKNLRKFWHALIDDETDDLDNILVKAYGLDAAVLENDYRSTLLGRG